MNRLFRCVKKNRDENKSEKLEKEEIVTSITSWSFNDTRQALSKSSFIHISDEIILHIFQFLSIEDLWNICLVCRCFKMIAGDNQIWKSKWDSKSNIYYLHSYQNSLRESIKLYSKSYKQMYSQWKYRQNKDFKHHFDHIKPWKILSLFSYPYRPVREYQFQSIGGFNQHPNLSQNM